MSDSDGSRGDRKRYYSLVSLDSLESEPRLRTAGSISRVSLDDRLTII